MPLLLTETGFDSYSSFVLIIDRPNAIVNMHITLFPLMNFVLKFPAKFLSSFVLCTCL